MIIFNNQNQYLNQNAKIGYFTQVVLSPNEFYTQKANIELSGFDKFYLVDLCGNVILDITNKVFIDENYFEIIPIRSEYYFNDLCLKFENSLTGETITSNPIKVTDEIISQRFDYKDKAIDKMQSIRLACYFNTLKNEISGAEYVNEIGNKLSSVSIITDLESYIFESLDNLTYRSLVQILNKPIKYINGKRITNSVLPKELEIIGNTNVGNSDFTVSINYNDTYTKSLQIADPLEIVSKTPIGFYRLDLISSEDILFDLEFNQNGVFLTEGSIKIYNVTSGKVFVAEIINLTAIGNVINATIYEETITEVGTYQIEITENYINSDFGSIPFTAWQFVVADGDFNNADFNSTDFFTN